MAILENTSYIKIIPSKCYTDHFVHVAFEQYESQDDREKEKKRESEYKQFCSNMDFQLTHDPNILNNEVFNTSIEYAYNFVMINYYAYDNRIHSIDLTEEQTKYLTQQGFKPEWCLDPIHKYPLCIVCCGVYNEEPVDTEFFYNKLKTVMNNNIIHNI